MAPIAAPKRSGAKERPAAFVARKPETLSAALPERKKEGATLGIVGELAAAGAQPKVWPRKAAPAAHEAQLTPPP